MTVDRNILPGMKPTRHSFRCGQPLGPGVAHHGMRNLVHHAQAHVASLAACKRITNKTGCHLAGGHGTSARDLNRNARTFTTGKLVSDARLSRHFAFLF